MGEDGNGHQVGIFFVLIHGFLGRGRVPIGGVDFRGNCCFVNDGFFGGGRVPSECEDYVGNGKDLLLDFDRVFAA